MNCVCVCGIERGWKVNVTDSAQMSVKREDEDNPVSLVKFGLKKHGPWWDQKRVFSRGGGCLGRTMASGRVRARLCIAGRSGWTSDLLCSSPRRHLTDAWRSSRFHFWPKTTPNKQKKKTEFKSFECALLTAPIFFGMRLTLASCPWRSSGTSWLRSVQGPSCSCWWRWRQHGDRTYQEEDSPTLPSSPIKPEHWYQCCCCCYWSGQILYHGHSGIGAVALACKLAVTAGAGEEDKMAVKETLLSLGRLYSCRNDAVVHWVT